MSELSYLKILWPRAVVLLADSHQSRKPEQVAFLVHMLCQGNTVLGLYPILALLSTGVDLHIHVQRAPFLRLYSVVELVC